MSARVLLTLNNNFISEYPLEREMLTIGRKGDNHIVIDHMAVSGKHARILTIGGESFLEDLKSTNGTYVNGRQITKQVLKHGDRISIGQHVLTFENPQAQEEGELEKTMVIRPYAVGMEGTAAIQAAEAKKQGEQIVESDSSPSLKPGEKPALLQLISGPNNGKKMALTKPITRLGKPGEQYAAIAKRPQGYFIMHLGGNTPQPLLNSDAVGTQAKSLKHGDIIEIGKVRMKILIPS